MAPRWVADPGRGVVEAPALTIPPPPRVVVVAGGVRPRTGGGILGSALDVVVVSLGLAPRTAEVGAAVVGTLADDAVATLAEVAGESATLERERAGDPTAFADMEEVLGAARVMGVARVGCTPETEDVLLAAGVILGLAAADVGLDPGVPLRLLTTLHAAGRACFGVVLEGMATRGLLPRTEAVALPLRVTDAVDPLRVTTDAFTTRVGLVDSHSAVTDDSRVSVSYTHLRAHETPEHLVCRLLLEKKKKTT
eukprot:TRINITY_DN17897_c0_g1_i3.p1 TRINITY_DN17897_c0_g1~~TRINITY_DN17897_c0_g1_i3.p1  ORF type:complete len:252 (-),score=23.67 TRINITY_DN17897_c0_g1_i3:99-854(-)